MPKEFIVSARLTGKAADRFQAVVDRVGMSRSDVLVHLIELYCQAAEEQDGDTPEGLDDAYRRRLRGEPRTGGDRGSGIPRRNK